MRVLPPAVDMALTSADNCYFVPNYGIEGKLCFTNLPSNTPTRAPGYLAPSPYLGLGTSV